MLVENYSKAIMQERDQARKEGAEEMLRNNVLAMRRKNYSDEQIADILDKPLAEVKAVISTL